MYSGRTVWSTRVQQQPWVAKPVAFGRKNSTLRATFATKKNISVWLSREYENSPAQRGRFHSRGLIKASPWGLIYDKLPNRYAIFTGGNREPISGIPVREPISGIPVRKFITSTVGLSTFRIILNESHDAWLPPVGTSCVKNKA